MVRPSLAGGGRLSLLNVRGPVYEVFSLTRLTAILDVRPQEAGGEHDLAASA